MINFPVHKEGNVVIQRFIGPTDSSLFVAQWLQQVVDVEGFQRGFQSCWIKSIPIVSRHSLDSLATTRGHVFGADEMDEHLGNISASRPSKGSEADWRPLQRLWLCEILLPRQLRWQYDHFWDEAVFPTSFYEGPSQLEAPCWESHLGSKQHHLWAAWSSQSLWSASLFDFLFIAMTLYAWNIFLSWLSKIVFS